MSARVFASLAASPSSNVFAHRRPQLPPIDTDIAHSSTDTAYRPLPSGSPLSASPPPLSLVQSKYERTRSAIEAGERLVREIEGLSVVSKRLEGLELVKSSPTRSPLPQPSPRAIHPTPLSLTDSSTSPLNDSEDVEAYTPMSVSTPSTHWSSFMLLLPIIKKFVPLPVIGPAALSLEDSILYQQRRLSVINDLQHSFVSPISRAIVDSDSMRVLLPPPLTVTNSVVQCHLSHTDRLPLYDGFSVNKPVCRIHCINGSSGEYLPALNTSRSALSMPVMSTPYNLAASDSHSCHWNETISLNVPMTAMIASDSVIVIELLDLASDGLVMVGWCFLSLLSLTRKPNIGQLLRLQLYHFDTSIDSRSLYPLRPTQCPVWPEYVWQHHMRRRRFRLPCTLHLRLAAIQAPLPQTVIGLRPMSDSEIEIGRLTFEQMKAQVPVMVEEPRMLANTRAIDEPCRLPSSLACHLPSGLYGCYTLRFSPSGEYLAAACFDSGASHSIKLFDLRTSSQHTIPSLIGSLYGHSELVYDIVWSNDSRRLVSVSGDCLANVYGLIVTDSGSVNVSASKPRAVFPHNSFVYACVFHPRYQRYVLTGAYDSGVRVWDSDSGEMLGCYYDTNGNGARINALLFSAAGETLYSGDGSGRVTVWSVAVVDDAVTLRCLHSTTLPDTAAIALTNSVARMVTSANRKELMVMTQSNAIYSLSLLTHTIDRKIYNGDSGLRHSRGRGCLSSDGRWVVVGDGGSVTVMSASDGAGVASLLLTVSSVSAIDGSVSDLAWSPSQHLLAVCQLGENLTIQLFCAQ